MTDQTVVLIRLSLQFVIAMTVLSLSWWLFANDLAEIGSGLAGAVVAAWINEGIHTGRQASKVGSTDA